MEARNSALRNRLQEISRSAERLGFGEVARLIIGTGDDDRHVGIDGI